MPVLPTRSQLKKNLKALRLRLEKRPMDLDARMRMARTHRLLGDTRDAISHYRAVARYLSLSGQPLQAIAVLKELLQVDPRHEETLLFLAKLYARTRSADLSNRGRVAVPILDDDGPIALPEGLPASGTGIWRAIRPQSTDVYTVVHEPSDVGADEEVSLAEELRDLDEAYDLDEAEILDEVVVEAHTDRRPAAPGAAPDEAPGDLDYELLGPVTTEDLLLPQVPLFSSLDQAAFVELGHAMVFQRAQAGDVLFEEGDPGDSCIVLSRGRAVATRKGADGQPVELMRLGEGDFAGVFALVAGQPRQAALVAETDLEYFEIDRLAIAELVKNHPSVDEALRHFFRERLLLNLLAVLPVFSALSPRERQILSTQFVDRRYAADDELFYEGYAHDGLWVLLEGQVKLFSDERGEIKRLVPGDYLGSFAGIDKGETACGAVATRPSVVALLSHKRLGETLAAHPDLARARDAFTEKGLMLGATVFAGNGRLPGNLG